MFAIAVRDNYGRKFLTSFAALFLCFGLTRPLAAQLKMNVSTQPATGVAGTTVVNAVASGFPTTHGAIDANDVTITLASSCGGTAIATTKASSIRTVMGTQDRVGFLIPSGLSNGTYSVTLSGKTRDGAPFQSVNSSCSEVAVSHGSPTLASCSPSTSLAVYAPQSGGSVTAYLPNGCWNCTAKGLQAVVIEGSRSVTAIDTPSVVNSCASNPANGATVCVGNTTDVYILQGNTLTKTLQSSSAGSASVSGGECGNCGVAMNPLTNQAVISISLPFTSAIPYHSGFQFLDLNNDKMGPIIPASRNISEEITLDPARGFLLSANESSNYDVFSIAKDGSFKEFAQTISPAEELDATAEDCSTGIAFATTESSAGLYITDLTQARFVPGNPGSWTAPQQIVRAPDLSGTGIAIAQGSGHLGIMTQEFVNGGHFAVIQLPSTSGTGVPQLIDYAVSAIPGFGGTADPHGVTAYTSPNDGKAYGIIESGVPAVALARIDLACVLALPRMSDSHLVSGLADSCVQIIPAGNQQPSPITITSRPVTIAGSGEIYQYRVSATDAYTFQLQYSLTSAPAGMVINSQTGLISWVPDPAQEGTSNVIVRVQNVFGTFASQQYQITVSVPVNRPPVITSAPVTRVTAGQPYTYQVSATDPQNRSVGFSFALAPTGMTIDPATGVIGWVPSKGLVGQVANVTVVATEAFSRLSATQSFTINIVPGLNHPPLITSAPATNAVVGQTYRYAVAASDPDNDPLAFSFVSAPVGMSIDSHSGVVTWKPASSDVGDVQVTLRAQDPGKLVATQSFRLHIQRAYPIPVIAITRPGRGTVVKGPIDIVADISDPSGSQPPIDWTVDLIRADRKDTRRIGAGSGAVTEGVIAHLDPTLIRDDSYFVAITVSKAGQVDSQMFDYSVATQNLKLGNFQTSFTDIAIPVAGIPLTISRNYDSLDTSPGDFGAGWRLGLPGSVVDTVESLPQQGFTPTTRIYVTTPDGRREGFTFTPNPPKLFSVAWTPAFTPDPGVYDTLTVGDAALVDSSDGFANYPVGGPYKPTNYLLTTTSRMRYIIDEVAGLQQIIDPNGNTVDVTPGGLRSSFGPSLGFERDTAGRITKITEPSGNSVRYQYDNLGNLISSFDQLGNETDYSYELSAFPHYLTKVQDPLGRPVTRNVYNGDGKLIAQCGANGNVLTLEKCVTFSADSDLRQQTIVNARGFKTELLMDQRGNILTEKHYTDNITHLDTVRTYDANNNVLTTTDPAGDISAFSYDGQGNLLSFTDPSGRIAHFTYNSDCNELASMQDPAGQISKYDFDGACNPLQFIDPSGRVTQFAYDRQGRPLRMTDALKNSWSWAYDRSGFVVSMTDPFGKVNSFTHNQDGDVTSQVDRLNRTIEYEYDLAHHLLSEAWGGKWIIRNTYDAAGQLASVSDPDSSITSTYDTEGNVSTVDDVRASAVPRVSLAYTYDNNGNIATVSDSFGGLTSYAYDGLDRLISISQRGSGLPDKLVDLSYNDSSVLHQVARYSNLTRTQPVAKTIFTYQCNSCAELLSILHERSDGSIIDQLAFSHDVSDRIIGIQDAEGRHSYEFDDTDSLVSANHTEPYQPHEFYVLDPAGNRLASHLNSVYTYSWQVQGAGDRLLQDDRYDYGYDDEGNLTSRRNRVTGSVASFSYDYANRLAQAAEVDRFGATISTTRYVYDVAGRRIESDENGLVSYFAYEGFNPVFKFDSSGKLTNRRFYASSPDSILAEDSAGVTRWFFSDNIGSIRDLLDSDGRLLDHYVYDSFGQVLSQLNPKVANDLQFTGREISPSTGLMYFRSRFYDPRIGRFISEDPLGFSGGDINPYRYVRNSPLDSTDPSGKEIFSYAEIRERVSAFVEQAADCLGEQLVFDAAQEGVYLLLAGPTGTIYQKGAVAAAKAANVYAGQTVREFSIRVAEHLRGGKQFFGYLKFGIPNNLLKQNPKVINTIEDMLMKAFNGKASLANVRNAPTGSGCL